MILEDTVGYILILLLALFFQFTAFDQPVEVPRAESSEREPARHGEILSMVRASVFFFFAWLLWFVLSLMSFTLNNCSNAFSACYTSPTYLITTTSIVPAIWAGWLGVLFQGFAWVDFVLGVVMSLYLWLPIDRIPKSLRLFEKRK